MDMVAFEMLLRADRKKGICQCDFATLRKSDEGMCVK